MEGTEVGAAPAWFPPLSPQVTPGGTWFRVVSRHATALRLNLYGGVRDGTPEHVVHLDAPTHRRDDVWEVLVPGVAAGQLYTWSAEGPYDPQKRLRFDPKRPLLDPYALALSGPQRFGRDDPARAFAPRSPWSETNLDAARKCVVVTPPPPLDWRRPKTPWRDSIVYELHTRGFTRHPDAHCSAPGTFLGLLEKIPYLRELGVTAVELLPVTEFDETETRPNGRREGTTHLNFWGYSPINWFAPNRRYAASAADLMGPIEEFRRMVLGFHKAGIEVVVDVVFNHTAELDERGPTLGFRGLDDSLYYVPGATPGSYANFSGCGNTVNTQNPIVRSLIRDALRWWAHGLGVDGFRFDLATILARDENGALMRDPPLIREIEEDPWLDGVHLITEPWDAAGGHLLGQWPGSAQWAGWNDHFRDDVRRAWFGDSRLVGTLASRVSGSQDLFSSETAGPSCGVNFISCHDGFTLRDAVSYARRHNDGNGEDGRDGNANEPSDNHGVEGPLADEAVRARRDTSRRNLIATLLLSQGVPMLLAGDEMGRTQDGNNNAYCYDNEISWVSWKGLEEDAAFHRFVRGLIGHRRGTSLLRRATFLKGGDVGAERFPDVLWIGPNGEPARWPAPNGALGFVLSGAQGDCGGERDERDLLLLVHLGERALDFRLPSDRHGKGEWRLVAQTAAPPPSDFFEPGTEPLCKTSFLLPARSLALFRAGVPSSPTNSVSREKAYVPSG
jgi:isoamylase